ncbi:MAG: toll/interleukin-1 receptor domain-containing protein [Rhodospirillales bacterium]
MTDVLLASSAGDQAAAAQLGEALEAAGLDVTRATLGSATDPGDGARSAPCVLALWSARAAAEVDPGPLIKLALSAWSTDRLILAVLDDSDRPAGLRDLQVFDLSVDRSRTTKQIIDRARQLKAFAAEAETARPLSPAESRPPAAPRRRPYVLAMLALVTLLILAGLVFRGWVAHDETTAPAPSAQEPVPGGPVTRVEPPGPPQKLAEASFLAALWPWGAVGGLLLFAGLVIVGIRRRRTRAAADRAASSTAPSPATPPRPAPAANDEALSQQIFVSYSRQDTLSVDRIVEHIERVGFSVWIDREAGGHGTQRYAAPIVRAIRSSQLVALMCSRNAFASDHVVREVYVAGDFRKPFIAFQLDQAQFPDDLIYFLSGFPRIPADPLQPEQLREEIRRYVS